MRRRKRPPASRHLARAPLLFAIAVIGVVASVGACAREGRVAGPQGQPAPLAILDAGLREEAGGALTDALTEDALLEAKLAEFDSFHDWRTTVFGQRTDNPAIAQRARSVPKKGDLKRSKVATIRAYHAQLSLTNDGSLEGFFPSLPFTRDGRLDEGVRPQEAELSQDEQARVMALLAAASDENIPPGGTTVTLVSRCYFVPHHVLVFFDKTGVPIGKLFVCLTCNDFLMMPSARDRWKGEPIQMQEQERATLKDILDAHGLGAWVYDERDPQRKAVLDYEDRTYGGTAKGGEFEAKRALLPSGVDPATNARRASKDERERYCVWLENEVRRRAYLTEHQNIYGTYECVNNGYRYSLDRATLAACATMKPCDVPMGKLEACMRAGFVDGPERICASGPAPECEGLLTCLPGVKWVGRVADAGAP